MRFLPFSLLSFSLISSLVALSEGSNDFLVRDPNAYAPAPHLAYPIKRGIAHQRRQITVSCQKGYGICLVVSATEVKCAPVDSLCCLDAPMTGRYCKKGTYCLQGGGCCPDGEICSRGDSNIESEVLTGGVTPFHTNMEPASTVTESMAKTVPTLKQASVQQLTKKPKNGASPCPSPGPSPSPSPTGKKPEERAVVNHHHASRPLKSSFARMRSVLKRALRV